VITTRSVVIAGGGSTGLMLAGELALAGVDVAVVERRPNPDDRRVHALHLTPAGRKLLARGRRIAKEHGLNP